MKKKGSAGLRAVDNNFIDLVWAGERPPRPNQPVEVLDLQYTGKEFKKKIEELREELTKKKKAGFVLCKVVLAQTRCLLMAL